jgi:hypothetical protein
MRRSHSARRHSTGEERGPKAPSCASPTPQLKREWSPVASCSPSQQGLSQHLKYMARARILEFESSHPRQAVSLREQNMIQACRRRRLGRRMRSRYRRSFNRRPSRGRSWRAASKPAVISALASGLLYLRHRCWWCASATHESQEN